MQIFSGRGLTPFFSSFLLDVIRKLPVVSASLTTSVHSGLIMGFNSVSFDYWNALSTAVRNCANYCDGKSDGHNITWNAAKAKTSCTAKVFKIVIMFPLLRAQCLRKMRHLKRPVSVLRPISSFSATFLVFSKPEARNSVCATWMNTKSRRKRTSSIPKKICAQCCRRMGAICSKLCKPLVPLRRALSTDNQEYVDMVPQNLLPEPMLLWASEHYSIQWDTLLELLHCTEAHIASPRKRLREDSFFKQMLCCGRCSFVQQLYL